MKTFYSAESAAEALGMSKRNFHRLIDRCDAPGFSIERSGVAKHFWLASDIAKLRQARAHEGRTPYRRGGHNRTQYRER